METTDDLFLGGRLRIRQPKSGYRAGADPVFLASSINAKAGDKVLDLGCGVGTAMLCLKARLPEVNVTGVELQEDLARLARENLGLNNLAGDIVLADIGKLPSSIREQSFDHVMTNPPFFEPAKSSPATEAGRDASRRMSMSIETWLDIALRRVRPEGSLTLINRIEQMPECIRVVDQRAGALKVLPLSSREGRAAKLFLLTARKGARAPMTLLPPIILHDGARHVRDGDNYSQLAKSVLRDGRALPL